MQKQYVTKSLTLGLLLISISIGAMEQQSPQHTLTVKAFNNYIRIRPQNKARYARIFATYGLQLDETTTKIVTIEATENIANTRIIPSLPIDTFTHGKEYIITTQNLKTKEPVTIKLIADALREENSFRCNADSIRPSNSMDTIIS